MTDQIPNLTEQSFTEICRIDQSLNETIWIPKCDKLHMFVMVEKTKRKFVDWILSLHTAKLFEAKVNSFCMAKLLMRINIVQTQLGEKSIYKLLSCFRKLHVLSRLLTRTFFPMKKETNQASWFISPTTHLHVNALTPVPCITSSTNSSQLWYGGRRGYIHCSFAVKF